MERIFFKADDRAEVFAISASYVRELASLGSFTPVPGASEKVVGVTQVRGKIVTILNVFGAASSRPRAGTSLLIVECPLDTTKVVVGIVIESLAEPTNAIAFDPVGAVAEIWREHGARG